MSGCMACRPNLGLVKTTIGPRGRGLGFTEGQRTGVVVGGLLLAAAGLAYAFRPRQKPRRRGKRRKVLLYHSRRTQRYVSI